ncbi:MAG: ABC transporter permease [Spirochaetales bacterium]|nr:ABC transporter permease [Spirochaetales bacterium]
MSEILNIELVAAAIRMGVPLLFAALGATFVSSCGMMNIAIDGSMLVGTFVAVVAGFLSQSLAVGFIGAGIGGMMLALLIGLLIVKLKGDGIVVGIGGNLFAWGITVFILEELFRMKGSFTASPVPSFKAISLPIIENIPYLNTIFSGYTLPVYLSILIAIIAWIVLYRTPIGLIIRGTGANKEAVKAAGINTDMVQIACFAVSGFLAGLGGACLSIANLQGFWTENMTAGRGYIALCAAAFGRNNPKFVVLACLLFGLADAIGIRFQVLQWEPSFVLMIPYIVTILMLWASSKKEVL